MLLLRWLQHMLKCPTACSKNEKNQKTSRKPKKIFQDSCKSKTAKIQKTSRKPNKPNKNEKKQYSRTLAKVKMKKSKKPREKKIPKDSCKSKHFLSQKVLLTSTASPLPFSSPELPPLQTGFEHGLCQSQQHCRENCSIALEPLITAMLQHSFKSCRNGNGIMQTEMRTHSNQSRVKH